MRFLVDESCDFVVVSALRAAGHDVKTVAEALPGSPDDAVLSFAMAEDRILLTEDRDFGRLAFAQGEAIRGVVYIRFPAGAPASFGRSSLRLVDRHGDRWMGQLAVLRPGRVRVTG